MYGIGEGALQNVADLALLAKTLFLADLYDHGRRRPGAVTVGPLGPPTAFLAYATRFNERESGRLGWFSVRDIEGVFPELHAAISDVADSFRHSGNAKRV